MWFELIEIKKMLNNHCACWDVFAWPHSKQQPIIQLPNVSFQSKSEINFPQSNKNKTSLVCAGSFKPIYFVDKDKNKCTQMYYFGSIG